MINIRSNVDARPGHHDTLKTLLVRLASGPLDSVFEHYGDFAFVASPEDKRARGYDVDTTVVCFCGNFVDVDHFFSIDTDDAHVIDMLLAAIRKNKASLAYRAARLASECEALRSDNARRRESGTRLVGPRERKMGAR